MGDTRLKTLVDGFISFFIWNLFYSVFAEVKKKICIALTSYDYFGPALDSEPLHVPPGTWNLYTVILVEDFLVNITMK